MLTKYLQQESHSVSCSPSSFSNSGLKQYKDRYSTEPTDKQRSLSSIHSLFKWIKGQGHVAVVFVISLKTYSLKVWFNCSTGINSFLPLLSLKHTLFSLFLSFTNTHSFLCVPHQLHSQFYLGNGCSVLFLIPTVLRQSCFISVPPVTDHIVV